MTLPYTYRIRFIPTGEYYYGVRYAKDCHPSDLWIRYFTSCTKVKKLIKEHGKENFTYEIRQMFDSKEAAILWEEKVTRKVIHWDNYLNANSGRAFNHSKSVNGGNLAVKRGIGIHAMTQEEKSAAGRKGGLSLAVRKRDLGLTENEKAGHLTRANKISVRRAAGNWTQKEIAANQKTHERRMAGEWTHNEEAAYAKLKERRSAGDWSVEELAGFEKVSKVRKSGRWITDGSSNRFITDNVLPGGWQYGFIRKKKGA